MERGKTDTCHKQFQTPARKTPVVPLSGNNPLWLTAPPWESSFLSFMKSSTCLQPSSFISLFLACRMLGVQVPSFILYFLCTFWVQSWWCFCCHIAGALWICYVCLRDLLHQTRDSPLQKSPGQPHLHSWPLLTQLRGPCVTYLQSSSV